MKSTIRQRLAVGITGMAMVVIMGCAQPPTEQLGAAQKAVEAAKAAGAPEYAKEDFVGLEQQYGLAQDELVKQERAFPIFRSYTDADKMLIKVAESGGQVATKAAQNKETAKTTALAMEKEAQKVLASTKDLMAKAPTGKERAVLETMAQDLSGLESSLGAVGLLIDKEDYLGAEIEAKALKEKLVAVSGEIQIAIAKAKGRKPRSRA